MTDNDPQRLVAHIWVTRLAWIQDRLREGRNIEPLLRHAFHLAQIAPLKFANLLGDLISEEAYEAALAHEDWDRAANLLLGEHVRIARLTPSSGVMAVIVRDERSSGSAIGGTYAQAALDAWIARIFDATGLNDTSFTYLD